MTWNKLLCNLRELQLMGTLSGGQSFRWTHNKANNEWIGVFSRTVWKLRENDSHLQYQVIASLHNQSNKSNKNKNRNKDTDFTKLLEDYFRLDVNLGEYYKEWSEKDELFEKACKQFYGIRMLRQEPVENLFSFICSQNNHISRISTMVEKLCTHYGEKICEYEGDTYYAFPEVEKLSVIEVETELRNLGFGYRAKFIQKSAAQIVEWGGLEWFHSLQDMKYKDAKQELMKLHGIGPKVADCICLMSLNHLEALPVDTHVYQIAAQNYLPHLRGKKNVTEKMYTEIGDHFRMLYGDMAGWAHTGAPLRSFTEDEWAQETIRVPEEEQAQEMTRTPEDEQGQRESQEVIRSPNDHPVQVQEVSESSNDHRLEGPMFGVLFCADLKKFQQHDTDCNNSNGKPTKKRKKVS